MNDNYGVIYKITNNLNGKIYIGQTKNFNRRINEYKHRSKKKDCCNYHILEVMHDIGFDNFKYEIIDYTTDKDDANIKESLWISEYNSNDSQYGYNMSSGYRGTLSNITKQKMHKSHIGCKESATTKRKKSNPIYVINMTAELCIYYDSAKLFADDIYTTKDAVKNALRMPCMIKEFYVFYADYTKRHEIIDKYTGKNKNIIELCECIDKGVETIESIYETRIVRYV